MLGFVPLPDGAAVHAELLPPELINLEVTAAKPCNDPARRVLLTFEQAREVIRLVNRALPAGEKLLVLNWPVRGAKGEREPTGSG